MPKLSIFYVWKLLYHQLLLGFLYELCDNSLGLWDCQGSRTCLTPHGPVPHYHGWLLNTGSAVGVVLTAACHPETYTG